MPADAKQIEAVMNHHINAVGSGDMADILSDYTEESLIFSPNGTYQGLANLPEFFTAWIESVPEGAGDSFEITHQSIVGEVAYIVWRMGSFAPFATDTYIIRDGKIMIQTFAAYLP
jgi:ketosteroid isomerase-like protein